MTLSILTPPENAPSALHSKKDPNWGTPPDWIARIRQIHRGRIALDPFSSAIANAVVQAERIFTPADDAFFQDWDADTLSINPPGLQVARAWRKLLDEHYLGRARSAVWVGFSIEQYCLLSDPLKETDEVARDAYLARKPRRELKFVASPGDFSLCILRKRISFVREDGSTGSPAHGNYVVGLGVDHQLWNAVMGPMGRVFHGPLASRT